MRVPVAFPRGPTASTRAVAAVLVHQTCEPSARVACVCHAAPAARLRPSAVLQVLSFLANVKHVDPSGQLAR